MYEFDKALKFIFKSLDIAKSMKLQNEIIDILLQINQIYTIKKKILEMLLKYLDEAYKVSLKNKRF